jgi:hypothetical protein
MFDTDAVKVARDVSRGSRQLHWPNSLWPFDILISVKTLDMPHFAMWNDVAAVHEIAPRTFSFYRRAQYVLIIRQATSSASPIRNLVRIEMNAHLHTLS